MNTEVSTVVTVYDWFATIASLAGVDMSNEYYSLDGTDLTSYLFQGGSEPERDHVLITLDNNCEKDDDWDDPNAGLIMGQYKMMAQCVTSDGELKGDLYLYDVVNDGQEQKNL